MSEMAVAVVVLVGVGLELHEFSRLFPPLRRRLFPREGDYILPELSRWIRIITAEAVGSIAAFISAILSARAGMPEWFSRTLLGVTFVLLACVFWAAFRLGAASAEERMCQPPRA